MKQIEHIFTNYNGKFVGHNLFSFDKKPNILFNLETGSGKGTLLRNLVLSISTILNLTKYTDAKNDHYELLKNTKLDGTVQDFPNAIHIASEAFNYKSPEIKKKSYISVIVKDEYLNDAFSIFTYPDMNAENGKFKRIYIHDDINKLKEFQAELATRNIQSGNFEDTIESMIIEQELKIEREDHTTKKSIMTKRNSKYFLGTAEKLDTNIILSLLLQAPALGVKSISIKQVRDFMSYIMNGHIPEINKSINTTITEFESILTVRNTDAKTYKKILSHKPELEEIDINEISFELTFTKEAIVKYNSILYIEKEYADSSISEINDRLLTLKIKEENDRDTLSNINLTVHNNKERINDLNSLNIDEENKINKRKNDYKEENYKTIEDIRDIKKEIDEDNKSITELDKSRITEERNEKKLNSDKIEKAREIERVATSIRKYKAQKENSLFAKETYTNTKNEGNKLPHYIISAIDLEDKEINENISSKINSIYEDFKEFYPEIDTKIEESWESRTKIYTISELTELITQEEERKTEKEKELEEINIKIKRSIYRQKEMSNKEEFQKNIDKKKELLKEKEMLSRKLEKVISLLEEDRTIYEEMSTKTTNIAIYTLQQKDIAEEIKKNDTKRKEEEKTKLEYLKINERKIFDMEKEIPFLLDVTAEPDRYKDYTINNLDELKEIIEKDINKYKTETKFKFRIILSEILLTLKGNITYNDQYIQFAEDLRRIDENEESIEGLYSDVDEFFYGIENKNNSTKQEIDTIVSNLNDTTAINGLWAIKEYINKSLVKDIKRQNKEFDKGKTAMGFGFTIQRIKELEFEEITNLEIAFNNLEIIDDFSFYDPDNINLKSEEIEEGLYKLFEDDIPESYIKSFIEKLKIIQEDLLKDTNTYRKRVHSKLKKEMIVELTYKENSDSQASGGNSLISALRAKKSLIAREEESDDLNLKLPFLIDESSKSKYAVTLLDTGRNIITQQDLVHPEIKEKCIVYINNQKITDLEMDGYNQELVDQTKEKGKVEGKDRGLWKVSQERDMYIRPHDNYKRDDNE